METRTAVQKLAKSIHSLLGLETLLISRQDDSVCNIIKDISSEEPCNCSQNTILRLKNMCSSEDKQRELGSVISIIQGDISGLNSRLTQLNVERRQVLSDYLDLKGNIRVFCRIRPIFPAKKSGHAKSVVDSDSSNVILRLPQNNNKQYSFDKIFDQDSTQDEVFSEVEPVIKSAVDGYNACIFAYGQTGTGKTFTMEGKPDCPGVVPRAIGELFRQAENSNHSFLFTFSMLEIYMGNLRDLLIPQMTKATHPMIQRLTIQGDPKGGIEIENLVEIRVSDSNQAKKLYALGSRFRSTASTNSNLTSSRSHCLMRITLTCVGATERRRETNKLWMVDLGGSERVLKTKAWGRRFEEGKSINLSLSALGDVISALQTRRPHIPFRNSKLTQVLRDSLGEDSKTLMLVHISPGEEDLCETICSLGFATRVRSIQLGDEESKEARDKKEHTMTNLLQKMKQLESLRQDIRRDIKRLSEGLKHLSRALTSDEHVGDVYKVSECNIKMKKPDTSDATIAPLSQLPTFMRPTICSRKKSCMDNPTTKYPPKKKTLPTRKKKPLSIRAESLTILEKGISEHGSTCSIAMTSCLEDYESEESHSTSNCDIKMVVFPEQEKPRSSLIFSKGQDIDQSIKGHGYKKVKQMELPRYLTVENWVNLQKSEQSTTTQTRGSKRVLAIPFPQTKSWCSGQNNKPDMVHHKGRYIHDLTRETNFNENKIEKLADVQVNENSSSEVVIGAENDLIDDLVSGDVAISPDDKVTLLKRPRNPILPFKIESSRSISPPDRCGELCENIEATENYIRQALADQIPNFLESCMTKDSGCNGLSPFNVKNIILDNNEELHENDNCERGVTRLSCFSNTLYDGIDDTESNLDVTQIVPKEDLKSGANITEENSEKEDLLGFQYVGCVTRHCLQKSSLTGLTDADQEDCIMICDKSDERVCKEGIIYFLAQKVQQLCVSVFLGLGIQNLGLGQDFYYGLML